MADSVLRLAPATWVGPNEWLPENLKIGDPAAWQIESIESADWALSRIADFEREIAENDRLAAAAVERIRLRTQLLTEQAQRGLEFFELKLRAYAEAHRKDLLGGGKKKSRALLHGSIGWRSVPSKLKVQDPDALLAWAQTQPVEAGLVRVTEAVDKKAVNALHEKTGELPPGVELEPEHEELHIKTSEKGEA